MANPTPEDLRILKALERQMDDNCDEIFAAKMHIRDLTDHNEQLWMRFVNRCHAVGLDPDTMEAV